MLDGGGKSAESSQKMAVMTFISTHTRDGIKELYKEVCSGQCSGLLGIKQEPSSSSQISACLGMLYS